MEVVFPGACTTSSKRFCKFDAKNLTLFQIKLFGKKIKEKTPAMYLIKGTAHSSFTWVKTIMRINRFDMLNGKKITNKFSFNSLTLFWTSLIHYFEKYCYFLYLSFVFSEGILRPNIWDQMFKIMFCNTFFLFIIPAFHILMCQCYCLFLVGESLRFIILLYIIL